MSLEDHALLFAVNKYDKDDFWEELKGPVNDSKLFKKWLVQMANVSENNIYEICDTSDGPPTSTKLLKETYKLKDSVPSGQRIGRRLYIFLAGHGAESTHQGNPESVLVTSDSEDTGMILCYPGDRAFNYFHLTALFEEVVLFMDCCRDLLQSDFQPFWPFPIRADVGAAEVKKARVHASKIFRQSREKDYNGIHHGIFSKCLMDGLNGKAINGEGKITGASLKAYLRKGLEDQTPDLEVEDDFVFLENLTPQKVQRKIAVFPESYSIEIRNGEDNVLVETITITEKVDSIEVDLYPMLYVFIHKDLAGNFLKAVTS